MPKLIFYYAAMNSGKSTLLLQSKFNYLERDMNTISFIPKIINSENIVSRIGLKDKAIVFDELFNFYTYIEKAINNNPVHCVLVDEAQFLKKQQVFNLCRVVDKLNIPVLCYGLRSDFQGEPFEGSKYLLTLSDTLTELKTICNCGKKAIMNMRKKCSAPNAKFTPIYIGPQIEIGGNDRYISLCRKCYFDIFKLIDDK